MVRHRGEVFGATDRLASSPESSVRARSNWPAPVAMRAASSVNCAAKSVSGVRCGFQEQNGRLRVPAVPHMKIDGAADDSQNQRMVTVQGIHHAPRLIDLRFSIRAAARWQG
jgi:hypothetical protein